MFYYLVRGLVKFVLLFLGLKFEGIHNLPKKGAVIIVANHVSAWDPLLVAVGSPRPVHFMAKAELYQNQILARLLNALNAFPVKRGQADRNAIRKALKLLESGKVLGIFPEGTRKRRLGWRQPRREQQCWLLNPEPSLFQRHVWELRDVFPGDGVVVP